MIFAICLACILAGYFLRAWVQGATDGPTLTEQLTELRTLMATVDERIKAATAATRAALANIAADIAAIKGKIEAGQATEATLADLEKLQLDAEALAAENPDEATDNG